MALVSSTFVHLASASRDLVLQLVLGMVVLGHLAKDRQDQVSASEPISSEYCGFSSVAAISRYTPPKRPCRCDRPRPTQGLPGPSGPEPRKSPKRVRKEYPGAGPQKGPKSAPRSLERVRKERTLPGFRARRARETLCGAGPIATLSHLSPLNGQECRTSSCL